MPRFPSGDSAYQQRYIEAFRGLTQMLMAPQMPKQPEFAGGTLEGQFMWLKWCEMFDALIAEEQQEEPEVPDPLE